MIKEGVQPVLYGELAKSKEVDLNGLRGINTQFNGYSIAEDETVVFPTQKEVDALGKKLFRKGHVRAGSKRETALVRVERISANGQHRQDWFNIGVLQRTANNADGSRLQIDDVRAELSTLGDAQDVMAAVIGKAIVGTGSIDAFGPKFDRQANDVVREGDQIVYEPRKYVTIDYVDYQEPAAA